MVKRYSLLALWAAAALAAWLAGGCGPSTELTGTPIPNLAPTTRITAEPPSLIETGFIVRFYWSGFDPDGRVEKYQWRICTHGDDGISLQDTLTFDPATGDTLNPWFETTVTDSTFLVSADIPDFPGDVQGGTRSYQVHTFWVRAVDEKGAMDPTPAYVGFTSTTLLPSVRIDGPVSVATQSGGDAVRIPQAATFTFEGEDPDLVTGLPTKMRYLWLEARVGDIWINSDVLYQRYIDELIDFTDSAWTDWRAYDPEDETRRITIEGLTPSNDIFYLLAIQVQDTAGAVSIGKAYGQQVGNVRIADNLAPTFTVTEKFLGRFGPTTGVNNFRSFDIAAGQELEFTWGADASGYLGTVESYRYGWNVGDPTDPDDPGWALQPGLSPQHLATPRGLSFNAGNHQLTVQVVDNSNQVSRWTINLSVVQVPNLADQFPLLLVDDVLDRTSNSWTSSPQSGGLPLDRDPFRDAFWLNVLAGPGGVDSWNPQLDMLDISEPLDGGITYRRAVQYRTLLWSTRYASSGSEIANTFRPDFSGTGDVDKYVWLVPYQRDVGNLLYTGNSGLISHLASAAYEMPVVFESREGNPTTGMAAAGPGGGVQVRRAFGRRDNPDGTVEYVGPTRYPFRTLGISVLDLMTSDTYYEFNIGQKLDLRRKTGCVSMKGIVVDPDFKADYFPGGAVFPDTIWTDPAIDWRDQTHLPQPGEVDILARSLGAQWGQDEFYNAVIVDRSTPWTEQEGPAWGCDGPCLEPMFRSLARFDWVRLRRQQVDPDDTWPVGYYDGAGQPSLSVLCGTNALKVGGVSAKTNDQVVGFIAQKTRTFKPNPVGDVVFGFDPYRFDNQHMTRVIQWVLGTHFGLTMLAIDEPDRF